MCDLTEYVLAAIGAYLKVYEIYPLIRNATYLFSYALKTLSPKHDELAALWQCRHNLKKFVPLN